MVHENVNTFVGLVLEGSTPTSAWRYCSKGSLQDTLLNTAIKIDWFFKYSLIRDLTSGLEFIHNSQLISHGSLKSTNCVINNRWVLKITDFGLPGVRVSPDCSIGSLLWTAPELLRMENRPPGGTQPGDIYSFAIIVQEIIARDIPFGAFHKTPQGNY
uniref:guanylate cyclase n=1 Tax=Romanomermis culicivorax TaxID=13658 RepID=A0A915I7X1_ROMCU